MARPESPVSPTERLARTDRVRRRAEYRLIQARGRRVHTPHFVILMYPSAGTAPRLGITVTRKIGGAVERNRVKRVVREVFRRNRASFPVACDVVFIAKAGAPVLGYADVLAEVVRAEQPLGTACRKALRDADGRSR
jgi:ribonuclease P protein component